MKHNAIKSDKYNAYLFVGPAVISMLLLVVYPLLYGIFISFFNTNLVNKWDFVGLANYAFTLGNKEFMVSIVRSIGFTIFTVAGHFIIGFILSILLNTKVKGCKLIRAILLLPWLFPEVVVAMLWKWIYNPIYGLFNGLFMEWGLIQEPIQWLSSSKTAFIAIIFVCIWKGYPLVMMNLTAGLQSISDDLYEAAGIDGANRWECFVHITLPGLRPVLIVTLILDTVWWFKHFTIIWLLTAGGPGNATMVSSIEIYKRAFNYFEWGPAAAGAAIIFLICVIIGVVYRGLLNHEED